ncbi:MAG: FAD-dependent oxidoreductase [Nocardioidaceae bacterium]|nr:FAD-dependent oxidoreductase [Nocardioidaceae bacterium]
MDVTRSLGDARPSVLWLDDPDRPPALDPLAGQVTTDLAVVGGGYTGLWTALRAKERYPDLDVHLVEAGECGWQASGRNGGFVAASLTHGFHNGMERWPDELTTLDRLGQDNLDGIATTIAAYDIDCHFERTGELAVATAAHQFDELAEGHEAMTAAGLDVELWDAARLRAAVDSPTYHGALYDRHGVAMVEPARLAWGLRQACLDLGVVIHEQTHVTDLVDDGRLLELTTSGGRLRARWVALATNGFPPLLRRLRLMTVPVYDHVLATEPLSDDQLALVGWSGRQGIGDTSNLFHYYRLTRDNRIVWGGYDAVYHFGSRISPELEQNERTHTTLARHFFETFPQLEGLRFTHRWGGVIDTCTRFSAFFGTAYAGRVAYALGYTGLGVGATRFGADVMLDMLRDEDTERTRLAMVREKPLPFPPEPARAIGINLTRWSLERADHRDGRRNLWLRSLDRLGLGFDS